MNLLSIPAIQCFTIGAPDPKSNRSLSAFCFLDFYLVFVLLQQHLFKKGLSINKAKKTEKKSNQKKKKEKKRERKGKKELKNKRKK